MLLHYQKYSLSAGFKKAKTNAFLALTSVGLVVGSSGLSLAAISVAHALSITQVVTGNTSAAYDQPGWMFDRDTSTATPFEFSADEASIGQGSLYVEPIDGSHPSNKFIAEDFYMNTVGSFNSFSYDFMIGNGGSTTDAKQFYLNVYTNLPNTPIDHWYDCRFDYVPSSAVLGSFNTFAISKTTPAAHVAGTNCPSTLAELPVGSNIRAFAINVGDTSASDAGLSGYLDNVIVSAAASTTTYDFEPVLTPGTKDDCKDNGWMKFNTPSFTNQGQCVSYVNHHDGKGQDDAHARN